MRKIYQKNTMFKGITIPLALSILLFGLLPAPWASAQVAVPNTAFTYSQNFNTLEITGTPAWSNNTTLSGWFLFRQPASSPVAITTYVASTGGSNSGSFYSYGNAVSTDRALGGLGSGGAYFGSPAAGAVAGWIAVAFTNNTGNTINSINISFDGEQWRNGGNTDAQTMVLEYGFGTTFGAVATWTAPGGNFDWTSPVTGASATGIDGNVDGLVSGRGGTLSPISWANGATLWIRWIELNDPGNDHGLAIDNFSFSINTMTVVADRLTFIGVPTTATTGQPFDIQVCATDANSNIQMDYATAIMLMQNMGMNAATILPMPTLNPTNGCVTFTIIPGAGGENIAFGATSAMLTGMSGNIAVSSACPQLVVPLECEILVDFNDFRGSGFSPNPSTGQFCSTNIEVTGFMPVNGFGFGGTATTDDFARGVTNGGVTTGGIYALNRGGGNYALWVQPTADDFTPGTITLRVQNNSSSTLEDLCFAYEMLVRNDGPRSNTFNFAVSKDNQNFTPLITYTSPAAADNLGNQSFQMGECLDGINLAPGEFVYLRWSSDDMGGSGARDEFGIDNIRVCVKPDIETDAVAVCEVPDFVEAERDQFYIVISDIDGGNAPYTISIEGEEDREFDGFDIFGPFDHSGVGNEVVVVTIRDARGFPVRVEVVEVLCGYPQNEPFCECELNIPRSPNAGAVLAQSAPGSFMAGGTSGNTQRYILTRNGIILAVNGTGLFTALADGDYEVYALNYCNMDEATIEAFLMTGLMIQPFIDGLNNQGDLSGACYSLCDPAFYTIECERCPEPEIANFGGPTVEDPCTCSNIDGYFDEEIVITALTGEVWQIGANTGFLDPNTLQPYPAGTQFTETAPGSGVYTLVGVHASGVGFSLSAVSPIFYPNITLAIENTCSYPQPQITSFLPDVICFNAEPIILTGEEANGAQGTGQFLINDVAAPVNNNNEPFFDPSAYPAGPQTITFVWDAGDPADPETKIGCVVSTSAVVTVSYEANIIAESANWTIPSCASEPLTVFYSFNLTGCAAENFDPASLTVDFNGLNAVFNYQEDAGDGTRFIEYALSITAADAGERAITISYDLGLGGSISVSPLINIIAPGNDNGPFITVNNTNPTLPGCATEGTALIQVFILSCDNILNPARLVFRDQTNTLRTPSFIDFTNAMAEYQIPFGQSDVNANPNLNFFSITYTDALGNSETILPGFVARQEADLPPVIIAQNTDITFTVCDEERFFVYSFNIFDDCTPINPALINISLFPGGVFSLVGTYFEPNNANNSAYVELYLTLNIAPPFDGGLAIAAISYAGGLATQPFITFRQEARKPALVIAADANVTALPCDAGINVCYSFQVVDECDDINPALVSFNGGGSGLAITFTDVNNANNSAFFEACGVVPTVGTQTSYVLSISYAGGQALQPLLVINQQQANYAGLGCEDQINVTLDGDCRSLLTPAMVLKASNQLICESDFVVTVVYPNNTTTTGFVQGCGRFVYRVTRANTGALVCWGYVLAEDKTPPVLVCPEDTDIAFRPQFVQVNTGSLSNTDPQFDPSTFSCYQSTVVLPNGPTLLPGNRRYDAVQIRVNRAVDYTFFLFTAWGDGLAALYEGAFDPLNPCENIIAFSDDTFVIDPFSGLGDPFNWFGNQNAWEYGSFNPTIRLTSLLRPGRTYTLVTTSWAPNTTGNYTWASYSSDPQARVLFHPSATMWPSWETTFGSPIALSLDLICTDKDSILLGTQPQCYTTDRNGVVLSPVGANLPLWFRKLTWTGYPHAGNDIADQFFNGDVTDNCGRITVCVSDQVLNHPGAGGDCAPVRIRRTFTARDECGQLAAQPCVQEITIRKPTLDDVILPHFTAYIECDQDFPKLSNGNPSPAATGYPFLITAFGIYDLNQTYCNLAASFEDKAKIDVCPGTFKFRREWTIYDWCAPGRTVIYNQLIKVGDFTPPVVDCPRPEDPWDCIPTYSTGPFACDASFRVPAPRVSGINCGEGFTYKTDIVTTVVRPIYSPYYAGVIIGYEEEEVVVVAGLAPNAFVSKIPKGLHRFRYTVEDGCKNKTVEECFFEVKDLSEPVAQCDDFLNISIAGSSAQGTTRVFARDIDEGSYDDCGLIRLEVRRFVPLDCLDAYLAESGRLLNQMSAVTTVNGVSGRFSPWDEYVDVICCDVNKNVRVELRVWDDANMDGIPGNTVVGYGFCETDFTDNNNVCWLDVLIEDKARPTCKRPADMTIPCTDDRVRYEKNFTCADEALLNQYFGEFEAIDNCGARIECVSVVDTRGTCGTGTITRTYRAVDNSGNVSTNFCTQVITVTPVNNYLIGFPADAEGPCADVIDTCLYIQENACDLLAVSVTDEKFTASGDECYKLFRTFRVINWCEYDGISAPIIIDRDEDRDNRPGDEDVWVIRRPGGGQNTFIDGAHPNANSNNGLALNFCGRAPNPIASEASNTYPRVNLNFTHPAGYWRTVSSRGFWQYTQLIKVYDNIRPVVTAGTYDDFCSFSSNIAAGCPAPVVVPFTIDENCTPNDLTIKVFLIAFNTGTPTLLTGVLFGTYPNYEIRGNFPIGNHTFEVHVVDGCANSTVGRLPFRVKDCKAPSPICINGLSLELMPDGNGGGSMAIWATDFLAGSQVSDCSGPITYSINRRGATPNRDSVGIVLTCADPATLEVEIYAWDSANNPFAVQPNGTVGGPNYDHCVTYVLVQDNMFGLCDNAGPGSIAGTISTEESKPVEGVDVQLSGQQSQVKLTNVQGTYSFVNLLAGYDYTIAPLLDRNYINGVSTFDIVLISKHILGVQPLNSPYKMIAADVNNSKSITTLDLIQLRKLILSVDTKYANNTSWRFVDASFVFPNPTNPWATEFPEVRNINNLVGTITNANFVAVKIGDVNGSAIVSALDGTDVRNLAGTFNFEVADEKLVAGNEYTVAFRASDLAGIQGYQGTLTFDRNAVELVDIVYGVAKEENFGLRYANEGVITTSWNGEANNDVAFSLVLRAKADTELSKVLGVSSRYTVAEAYNRNDQVLNLGIQFSTGTVASVGFELYQNVPNPFKGQTVIGFNLPVANDVTLTISDMTGRVLKLVRNNYDAGYNTIILNSNDLPAGVLNYTLKSGEFVATKKMVVVE